MKYGPIICNPNSEEAKRLVGKKIVGCWSYNTLDNMSDELIEKTLLRIGCSVNPFVVDDTKFTFIREVIDDSPKYRPYETVDELVADWKAKASTRFVSHDLRMPPIWVKKTLERWMITGFDKDGGCNVFIGYYWVTLEELFEKFTYLDGTPCGKEVD